jgi:hypothetical protein
MRVNANRGDGHEYYVYLNSRELPFCTEADDAEGYAICDVALVLAHSSWLVHGEDPKTGKPMTVVFPEETKGAWATYILLDHPGRLNETLSIRVTGTITISKGPLL